MLFFPRKVSILVMAALLAGACSRDAGHSRPRAELPGALLISQFYARDVEIFEGQSTVLCYQVENALSVEIAPRVAQLRAAPVPRCVEVTPDRDTTYTLTAQDSSGLAVRESAGVRVRPDPERLPAISYFTKEQKPSPDGRLYLLCFFVRNAQSVEVSPDVLPSSEAAMGCFYVHPARTTTYVLTAHGDKGRKARESLDINVPERN